MKRIFCSMILSTLMLSALNTHPQEEWARVSIDCPCTLESDDGETAKVTFGATNHETLPTDNLYATIAITGYFEDEEFEDEKSAFLGTVAMHRNLAEEGSIPMDSYDVEFGQLPKGNFFLELIVHEGPVITPDSVLDFVWFEGETQFPVTSIHKKQMDFLVDSDEDGVADVNERMEGTDPLNALDFPPPPTIDVAVIYDSSLGEHLAVSDLEAYFSHLFAVSNYFYQRSGATLDFRMVALLDEEQIPEVVDDNDFLPMERRDEIVEEYGADLVVVFHPGNTGLCGIAEDIGGWRGRGFIHRLDRAILTHVWLNNTICPLNVTAHEIGHLLGLGHSYVQGAIGTFYWSRGHGEEGEFGTVMSYADRDYNGIDIDKFSNPHENCNSHPCGISHELPNRDKSADAVLSVNITKYQVAATSDPPSTLDIDGDGYAADVDLYPLNPNEWSDTDGDGIGDNADLFPHDASEWADTDGDGIGNNKDPDIDNDGILNHEDADPFDSETGYIRLLRVVSDHHNDRLGLAVVRTNDLDEDGVADLAVSAPAARDGGERTVGKVYLFSLADLVTQPTTSSGSATSKLYLSELVAQESSWVLQGTNDDVDLGEHLHYLASDSEATTPNMLLVSTRDTVYVIQLDTSALHGFDALDGRADRTLSLDHCTQSSACWYIGENHSFKLHDIAVMHDRDLDGVKDFAVIGEHLVFDDTSLYLITTSAITSYDAEDEPEQNVFDVLVSTDEDCYRIHTDRNSNLSLSDIGDVRGYIGHELGIGINGGGDDGGIGSIGVGGGQETGAGTAYILNTELAQIFDLIDGSQDGEVKLEDFIGGEHGSLKLTSSNGDVLARNMNSIADLDGDNRPETIIWGGSYPHPVVTNQGFRNLDAQDGDEDGFITIPDEPPSVEGVWYLDSLEPESGRTQTVIQSASANNKNTLLGQEGRDVVSAHFDDFDELATANNRIDLFARLMLPQVYHLINLRDLRRGESISGMTALGDVDADGITDYLYTTSTQDVSYYHTSVLQVIFSSSMVALDRADGAEDGVVSLHNNLEDTDADGVINLHDLDDDNDGALDSYDEYPLHASAIYDNDGDHVADSIDQFPGDPHAHSDLDFDGNADRYDPDIDGDGIANLFDDFPRDTDNDGIPNIFDSDDDGDGVADVDDAFPLDPNEQYDSDGDGYADGVDLFVNDPTEWEDFDGDGVGNNSDSDDDNDGVEDSVDLFPFNASEWADTDGDGVGNNADSFPDNYFEWEDADGDGIGDYLKGATISSYKIDSDWGPLAFFADPASSHALFELSTEAHPRIVLQNASPHDFRSPTHILSLQDLVGLDQKDKYRNHTININDISSGSHSWELRGSYTTAGAAHQNRGAIVDVHLDGVADLLMSNFVEDSGSGMITIVNGSTMEQADAFDGTVDGKINYVQCVRDKLCTNIRATDLDYFGYSITSLKGLYGSSTWGTIGVSNLFGSEWQHDDLGSPPIALIVSTAAIADLPADVVDADFTLDRVLGHDDVLRIYSEFSQFDAPPFGTQLAQLADYDGDGAEDLLLFFPTNSSVYFLASQDILAADENDNQVDDRVSVATIVSGENSYRIDNFIPITSNARTSTPSVEPNNTQLIPLQSQTGDSTFLIDVSDLSAIDQADGEANGIISDIDVSNTNSWQIDGLTAAVLCNNSLNSESTYAFGISESFFDQKIYMFTLGTLEKIAESGTDANVVNLPDAASTGNYDIWTIQLGEQLSAGLNDFDVACAGDFDADQMEDFVLSFTTIGSGYTETRTSTIVMMSSDLGTVDGLDGTTDKNVDLSRLWRSPDNQ